MKYGIRLAEISGTFLFLALGWACGHRGGAVLGVVAGLAALVLPWRGQPLWRWVAHYLTGNRSIELTVPATVTNDRAVGGIRYQDGTAVAVVQLLGKPHRATLITGSSTSQASDVVDISSILPLLRQNLGLAIDSISVITTGARRRSIGDYPRVYDTLLGSAPCAGSRETWLVVRMRDLDNGDALRWRPTVGTTALAAAQRIASALRCAGVRGRVATASDIMELDRRLGAAALEVPGRRWHALRGEAGWLATYAYRSADISTEGLARAWSLTADRIVQNVTIFPDGTCCAAVTIQTSQPPTAAPSVALTSLPGEQARALANNLCGPRWEVHGQSRAALPMPLRLPVGPSGILLGKLPGGDRLLLPLRDPGDPSRVSLIADDTIVKRIIIRSAAAGERITLHTNDIDRWDSVRMPHVLVTDQPRPAPGTTVSVTDGTVSPTPRPATVIEVGKPGAGRGRTDVALIQTGPATLEVRAAGEIYDVEMEFFRAENRYAAAEHGPAGLQMVGGQ